MLIGTNPSLSAPLLKLTFDVSNYLESWVPKGSLPYIIRQVRQLRSVTQSGLVATLKIPAGKNSNKFSLIG